MAHRDRYATVSLDAHDLADWRGLAPTVVTPSFAEATRLLARAGTANRADGHAGLYLDHPEEDRADGPSELTVGAAPGEAGMRRTDGPTGEPTPGEGRVAMTGDGLSVTGTGVTVNAAAGAGIDRAVLAQSRLAELRAHTGAAVVAVTLDTEGAVVGGADGEPRRSHSTPVPASHAVGAGDAYLAAMTLALAAAAPLPTAAQLAQLAATITVSGTGTCVCRRDDLLAALDVPTARPDGATLVGADDLTAIAAGHRAAGRSVVFTNGCFDVLHRGHVRYLAQARALGDVLVVAVNSDGSVRRLKGPDRPVNPVEDRVALLAALSCVDHVVVFEEDSPAALIEAVRPQRVRQGWRLPAGTGARGPAGAPTGRAGPHPRVRAGPLHLRHH